jgi:hypothetical protein
MHAQFACLAGVVAAAMAASGGAFAQEACLSVAQPQVTLRSAEGCRIQAAVANACDRPVRYAIVRAVPHPQRGPLPTVTLTVGRFRLDPLLFERELCDQSIRIIELSGDGASRDVTLVPLVPATPLAGIDARARSVNACVAACPVPDLDQNSVTGELRNRFRHALDDTDGRPHVRTVVDAVLNERRAQDRVCAEVCHGRLAAADAPAAMNAATSERTAVSAAALAALGAIAARPPRMAAPEPAMPVADDSERRPPGQQARRERVRTVQVCRRTAQGRRCSMVIQRGQAQAAPTRPGRQTGQRPQRRGTAAQQRRQRQGSALPQQVDFALAQIRLTVTLARV